MKISLTFCAAILMALPALHAEQQPLVASGNLARMIHEDLPLPSDWARQLQGTDAEIPSPEGSFPFSGEPGAPGPAPTEEQAGVAGAGPGPAPAPGPGGVEVPPATGTGSDPVAPDATPTTGTDPAPAPAGEPAPVPAPAPAPPAPETAPAPAPEAAPAVTIIFELAGPTTRKAAVVQAIINYIAQQLEVTAVLVSNSRRQLRDAELPAFFPAAATHRVLQGTGAGQLCGVVGAELSNSTIEIPAYSNQAQVVALLDAILSGETALKLEDGTLARDSICKVDTKLSSSVAPLNEDVTEDKASGFPVKYIITIVVVGAAVVLVMGFLLFRRRNHANVHAI